jgi:hypothetical protein
MVQRIQERTEDSSIASIVIDMHCVTNLEFTGIEELATRLIELADTNDTTVRLVNCSLTVQEALDQCDPTHQLQRYSALTETL